MQNAHTINDLKQMQSLPLSIKIRMTERRIRDWVNEFGEDGVYVSFSGGKDSTVLLDIVRNRCGYKNIPAVFVNTGLEYPEIVKFVHEFDNVVMLRPKMNFKQVIQNYGYPFISKEVSKNVFYARNYLRGKGGEYYYKKMIGEICDKNGDKSIYCTEKYSFFFGAPFGISANCCNIMKKSPAHDYDKKTGRVRITAEMAGESRQRMTQWLQYGCNSFDSKHPASKPLSFWTEQDILHYIKENEIPICSVYGDIVVDQPSECENQISIEDLGLMPDNRKLKTTGCTRTGCMFCGYGCHLEKPGEGRFERMKETHPKLYDYIMRPKEQGGLNYKEVIDWINEHGGMNIRY